MIDVTGSGVADMTGGATARVASFVFFEPVRAAIMTRMVIYLSYLLSFHHTQSPCSSLERLSSGSHCMNSTQVRRFRLPIQLLPPFLHSLLSRQRLLPRRDVFDVCSLIESSPSPKRVGKVWT